MNLAKYSIEHNKIIHLFLVLILIVGAAGFFLLGQKGRCTVSLSKPPF